VGEKWQVVDTRTKSIVGRGRASGKKSDTVDLDGERGKSKTKKKEGGMFYMGEPFRKSDDVVSKAS